MEGLTLNKLEIINNVLSTIGKKHKMSVLVSKTIYSAMKRDIEKKRNKVAKETVELKGLEASFKQMKVVKLSKR